MDMEMIKSFEELQSLGKGNLDACVACATAFNKGFQAIAAEAAEFSRQSVEKSTQVTEKVLAAKSFDKALEVQQGFAKESMEAYLAQLNKMGELYMNATKDAFKPFEGQLNEFTGKVASK